MVCWRILKQLFFPARRQRRWSEDVISVFNYVCVQQTETEPQTWMCMEKKQILRIWHTIKMHLATEYNLLLFFVLGHGYILADLGLLSLHTYIFHDRWFVYSLWSGWRTSSITVWPMQRILMKKWSLHPYWSLEFQ